MSEPDDGGPAFPSIEGQTIKVDGGYTVDQTKHLPGMTMRQYYIGQAMAGVSQHSFDALLAMVVKDLKKGDYPTLEDALASSVGRLSILIADATIEREKKTK